MIHNFVVDILSTFGFVCFFFSFFFFGMCFPFFRYFDPLYYNYRPAYPSHGGFGMPNYGLQPGAGYGPQRENDDRNWYYPNMNDDRNRYAQYENRQG